MIDLDDMESLLQHCKELDEAGGLANRVTPSVVIELITLLRQAEKDAARYRWLRDLPDGSAHEEIGNYPGDMWDESIDEAMQCK